MRLLSEHGKGTEVTEWSLCELQSLLASPPSASHGKAEKSDIDSQTKRVT